MIKASIGPNSKGDVWFVYDGDCPICQMGARGLKIHQAVGTLHLVDARAETEHPILQEINALGLNLDDGMVIKFQNTCYHGADALQVMGLLGTNRGWVNRMNYLLFRSKFLSHLCYPVIRSFRNVLLKIRGIEKIKNLHSQEFPIFQSVFGEQWQTLPPVMHQHYANRPCSHDTVIVEGTMDISFGTLAKILNPLLRILGALVPYQGTHIPTTVTFRSEPDSNAFCFDRAFHFPEKPVYHFRSRMIPQGGNLIIEYMRFGIGWRTAYTYEQGKVFMRHKGYVWKLFGIVIPLPLALLFGKGYAEEEAISDTSFRMRMEVVHPLWGEVYAYQGTFKVVSCEQ